jgi:GH18 family chitinase
MTNLVSDTKEFFNVAYVEVNSNNFANVGCYALPNGQPFFDFACIFAANINVDEQTGNPVLFFNPQVSEVLNNTNDVKTLQNLGIKVLLTVLGNHQNAGWSCFTQQPIAQDFARQLADCVNHFGLDGIDIDDEYSTCPTNDTSLIMVTSEMQQAMPGKIISKALFSDSQYFDATWNNLTLADTLTYGWEMSYGDPDGPGRLAPYLTAGMKPKHLALGVSTAGDQATTQELTQYIKDNNFGGMMVYNVTNDSQDYLSIISQVLYGENTIAQPNCLS